MRIPIDRESAIPLYRQIEGFFRQAILSGSLAAETRLPASRSLARDLGVNRITIDSAYAGLEAEGLIYTRPRIRRTARLRPFARHHRPGDGQPGPANLTG
jgi:DNA-binding transcriptional regulator YhcF (GntR family)